MRERVEMLGGTLSRSTEAGTTLTITLPLKAATHERESLQN
jgi:signal transduction histidine kinase